MARKELTLEPRQVTGKKVAQLRRSGILPANIVGRHLESVTVQVDTAELVKTLKASTKNEVIDLKVTGEKTVRPAIIQRLQRNPLNGSLLHADFYQVSLRERMKADVPITLTGTSDAVETYRGVLTQQIDTVQVEALPLDIPTHLEVDISVLDELDTSVHVAALTVPENVTILTAPDVVVVSVSAPAVAEEIAAEEEAAAAEAAEEAAAEEAPAATKAEESEAAEESE